MFARKVSVRNTQSRIRIFGPMIGSVKLVLMNPRTTTSFQVLPRRILMPTKEKETTRRNGYYQYKDLQFPSVSTIMKSAGNPGGLINWAATQGGMGVIWGLGKIKDIQKLDERLNSPACIEWAKEQAQNGLSSESSRVQEFGTL